MRYPSLLVIIDRGGDCPFEGETFDPERDFDRLHRQLRQVYSIMADGKWHTDMEIAERVGCKTDSAGARRRDLKKIGITIERRRVSDSVWEYRLVLPPPLKIIPDPLRSLLAFQLQPCIADN